MVVKMFLSVIYYQVEDMHQLSTVGSQHGQPGLTGSLVKIHIFLPVFSRLFFLQYFSVSRAGDTLRVSIRMWLSDHY